MFKALKGDKVLWGILALLAIFSFLPVFSASTNSVSYTHLTLPTKA